MIRTWILIAIGLGCFLMACGGNTTAPITPTVPSVQATIQIPTLVNPTSASPTSAPVSTEIPAATMENAAPTQTSGSSGNLPAPPSGSGYDFIRQATLNQLESESFRATTETKTADGTESTLLLEYVKPDRIHMVIDGATEQIAIKDVGAWSKANGAWVSMGDATAGNLVFAMLTPEQIDTTLQLIQASSVRYVGTEVLDGKPTFVYEYASTIDMGGQSVASNSRVWIDAQNPRVVRLEASSDSILVQGEKDTVTVEYEYDIPITIEPPI